MQQRNLRLIAILDSKKIQYVDYAILSYNIGSD